MRFKEFLVELDTYKKPSKGEKQKKAFKDLHAQQQQKKANDFEAKWNTGMPVKIKLKVYTSKPSWTGEDRYHEEEFIIDNLLAIRHKLDGVALIDMSKSTVDPTKHREKASYAVMQHSKNSMGSLPEYLHGLPSGTRKRPGYEPNDLRREAWTDSPLPYKIVYKEGKLVEAAKFIQKDIVKNAKFTDGKRKVTVTGLPTKENGEKVKFEVDGKERQTTLYSFVLWLNDGDFVKGHKKDEAK